MAKSSSQFSIKSILRNRPKTAAGLGIVFVLLLLVALSGGEDQTQETEFFVVKRGDFPVTIIEGGSLEAVRENTVRCETRYASKIVYIVPEGTYVEKGDLLVEMDSSELEDRIVQEELSVENARFDFVQAKETLEIQKSVIDSDVKKAELAVEFAETDLRKYMEGEMPQKKRNAEIEITNVQETLALAEETLDWSEKLADKGFETQKALETERLKVNQQRLKLEQAKEELRMLIEYTVPKELRKFQADLEEAKAALSRAIQQGQSKIAQYEESVKTRESRLELNIKKLDELKAELKLCKSYAPESGLVVYPFANRYSSQAVIEEGAMVRYRQELVKLPDTTQMKVTVKVHESRINHVKPGQPAYVILDPFPDKRFPATVSKVAILPNTADRYSNPNLKVYSTEVLLNDTMKDIKPGVSARAEIIITNLQNVIKVPIQSVTTHKGKQVCYVSSGDTFEPVEVEVGLYNNRFIEIPKGLEDGMKILLSPPLDPGEKDLSGSMLEDGEEVPKATTPPKTETPNARPEASGDGGKGQGSGQGNRSGRQMTPEQRAEMMKRFDKDGDGQLSDSEREAMRSSFQGRSGGGGGGGAGGEGRPPRQGGNGGGGPRGEGGSGRPSSGGGDRSDLTQPQSAHQPV